MRRLFAIGLLAGSGMISTGVMAGPACSGNYLLEKIFPSGAKWQLCWEHRQREGIVYHDIFYTPPQGTERRILKKANVSQVHVPYDDNGARFHDVSDFGLGGNYLNDLQSGDCPGGTRRGENSKNMVCALSRERNHAHAHHAGSVDGHKIGYFFEVFSVTHVGAYNYMPTWRFNDDGSIDVAMGATGTLQRYRTGSQYKSSGWLLNSSNRYGVSHLHNYYWRLDFDLGADANDDVVEEIEFVNQAGNLSRKKTITTFVTEKARSIAPERYRSWRIRDGSNTNTTGHAISYEIEPLLTGHRDDGPSYEPWTLNDFYVTVNKGCEKYASHNPQINGCADNLSTFVNGQNLNGKDLVIWYGMTFHHIPRDEDEPVMHSHWNSFKIVPRNVTIKNPLADDSGSVNTPPVLTAPGDQTHTIGDTVSLTLTGSDSDGDSLSYSASNLPDGLSLSGSGQVTGVPTTAGTFLVSIIVSDGAATDQKSFTWTIQVAGTGGCTTYTSSNVPVVISSSGTPLVSSILNVTPGGIITDINVLNLQGQHTYLSNLDFTLASPAGTSVQIMNSSCGNTENFNLNLDDAAPAGNWPCPPTDGGSYRPSSLLAAFTGEQSAGDWVLSIQDSADQDGGNLDSWSLEICRASVPVNLPPIVTSPGNQGSTVGDVISLAVVASDPESDALTYSAVGLPSGLQIDSVTGVISGTLAMDSAGPHSISITVDDGQNNNDSAGFGWLVEALPQNPECGAPTYNSATEKAVFLWKDCASGQWLVRVSGGGSTAGLKYIGNIKSLTGFTSYTPYSFEGSDVLTISSNNQQLDYKMRVWNAGEDGFSFIPGANACFSSTAPTLPVLLGANRQSITTPIDLDTLGSCQVAPQPDECGQPTYNSATERGVFLWKNCTTGQWQVRVSGGGSTSGLKYSGYIESPNGFSTYTPVSYEANDVLDYSSTTQQLNYLMNVWNAGQDGIDFVPGSNACFSPTAPNLPVYLGANKQVVSTPINLDTLGSCQIAPSPIECGRPGYDRATEKGTFIWKSCTSGEWSIRVTGGGDRAGLRYSGNIIASGGFTSFRRYSFEASDRLDNNTAGQLEYLMRVWNIGEDGFQFVPQGTACLTVVSPAVPIYVGATRVEFTGGSLDLGTLEACQ